jgi:hypothetical protein
MPDIRIGIAVRCKASQLAISIRHSGGFTFAEHPAVAAPDARLIWCAPLDPGVLRVDAILTSADNPERVDPVMLKRWITAVTDRAGAEQAVLSDGRKHIRLEIDSGTLRGTRPVLLRYRLAGIVKVKPAVLTLSRFLDLYRHRRFSATLFPRDRRIPRWIQLLRIHDARAAGASQREIAEVLFGSDEVAKAWRGKSDAMRAHVRRMIKDAQTMAAGRYRELMQV